jgi:aryl-alcohol dehydrogenase-like predicted oxidoreductase
MTTEITPTRLALGSTGLQVSPICYGSWQANPKMWGDQSDEALIGAMRRAFEIGINFFDTADAYGDGRAEELLGEALKDFPRDELVITTKVYHHIYPDGHRHPDTSADWILEACEASLKRLRLEYLDLYQIHKYSPIHPPEEFTAALEKLKAQGKIRHYGLSNFTEPQIRLARRHGNYETLQPRYHLLKPVPEDDMLPTCMVEGMGVFVYSPLYKGLLTGKYTGTETFDDLRRNDPNFQGERFRKHCENVRRLEPLAKAKGLSIVQLVLAATLMHPGIHCAIVGIKRAEQIEEAAGAMGKTLTTEEYWQVRNAIQGRD